MDTLPPQRAAVLAFLRDRIEGQGLAPSLADVAQEFGFASRNAAQKHVQALVADGLIELAPGQKRGIRMVGGRGPGQLVSLPVLGRVAAGSPIGAPRGSTREKAGRSVGAWRRPTPAYVRRILCLEKAG